MAFEAIAVVLFLGFVFGLILWIRSSKRQNGARKGDGGIAGIWGAGASYKGGTDGDAGGSSMGGDGGGGGGGGGA